MFNFIVHPMLAAIDRWRLRRARAKKNIHLMSLKLEAPLMRSLGLNFNGCLISIWVTDRDDPSTREVFEGGRHDVIRLS